MYAGGFNTLEYDTQDQLVTKLDIHCTHCYVLCPFIESKMPATCRLFIND
jgi:hypothetical protein